MHREFTLIDAQDRRERISAMLKRVQGDTDYEVLKDWRRYGRMMKYGKTRKARRHAHDMRLLIAHLYLPNLRRILPKWRRIEAIKRQQLKVQHRR